MSDFVQTMKDWRRMCKFYSDKSMAEDQNCIDLCPLGHNTACGVIENALDSDIEDVAKEIAKWATEHPEPVYPTWGDWLVEQGIIEKEIRQELGFEGMKHIITLVPTGRFYIESRVNERIPADIAQKLGIKPKEGLKND